MPPALAQPDAESSLWLPPGRMRRYALARVIGGVLFAAIFAGWIAIQWSNVTMRIVFGALIVVTAWVTAASIAGDVRRMRGRQVACDGQMLIVTTPEGEQRVTVADIAGAAWSVASEEPGLRFGDRAGRTLARLDENIIADEAEARVFLRWLRAKTAAAINATWNE